MQYEQYFPVRLAHLRMQKGVSAREMSLSVGQSPSYINKIENGKALPSMQVFFYICEYLNVTPREFFETGNENPHFLSDLVEDLKALDHVQLTHIAALVRDLRYRKK